MNENILKAAYGGLLHDIGKFWQRANLKADLSEEEKQVCPIEKKGGYYSHLHAGYTDRFFRKYLYMNDEFERVVSEHHLQPSAHSDLSGWIIEADRIASAIDRQDERSDTDENNARKRNSFQQVRLNSVFSEIDFGRTRTSGKFPLDPLSCSGYPREVLEEKSKAEAVEEYRQLFDQFIEALNREPESLNQVTPAAYNRLYALLYEYATFIPASTYEGNITYVSLFDHLKLTSAIASCLAASESDSFRMLEFDISGIQKFIFRVTEGSETKGEVAKSLRGRSLLISFITDYITYSYLHEFSLTQANIIFQTGGGALLLLPDTADFEERIRHVTSVLTQQLYSMFQTDITFVQANVLLDKRELENFKTDKAIRLKSLLEEEKSHKFSHLMKPSFSFEEAKGDHVCELCENVYTSDRYCPICEVILELSDFFIKHTDLYLIIDFQQQTTFYTDEYVELDFGNMRMYLTSQKGYRETGGRYTYIESINHSRLGATRYISSLVPLYKDRCLNFEEICSLIRPEFGDPKLGILKMDVDNLGSVFAYGMPPKTRSLSKFLTLSRLMELFFGKHLNQICLDVSKEMMDPEKETMVTNSTMFYINYAGGDDLVIIGPAAGILRLAEEIDRRFREYTKNQNITISGGIYIQRSKEPIRFGTARAEEYLERAKNQDGKNSVTLLDSTWSFREYHHLLEEAGQFRQDILDGSISRTSFYTIMSQLNVEDFEDYVRKVPILLYGLKRNIQKEEYRKKWIKMISEISKPSDWKQLRRLVTEMKLAIMQTREN